MYTVYMYTVYLL